MGRQELIDEKLLADLIRCAKKLETAVGKCVLPVSDEDLQSLGLLDVTAQISAFVKLKLAICARPISAPGFFFCIATDWQFVRWL